MYAQVIFPIASFKSFTYKIPKKLQSKITIGSAIYTHLNDKNTLGYVIAINSVSSFKGKIFTINDIYNGSTNISQELWKVIIWMSEYYLCPLGICIKAAFPPSLHKENPIHTSLYIEPNKYSNINHNQKKLSKNQKKLLLALSKIKKPILASSFKNKISNLYYVIESLSKKNIVKKSYFDKLDKEQSLNIQPSELILSNNQNKIFKTIVPHVNNQRYHGFLIHGVPGSGKTEIYIKLAQEAILKGKTVIVLIPEIILSTQMQDRFIRYFGNSVAIWHSKMTSKEKKHTLKNISSGQYKVIIGARSCIFTPTSNLGLIIIDEEQDSSYKQESTKPYYNARDIGLVRALHANCPIVLTSATPSLETYHNTLIGKINLLKLNEKYYKSKPPTIKVVNLLEQTNINDINHIISPLLLQSIIDTLDNKKQCILLNNRRGYATSVFSKESKESLLCINCNVPMSYHKVNNTLLCHYCNYKKSYNIINVNKKPDDIILHGYGTQRIYELLKNKLPNSNIARVDSDSLSSTLKLKNILHSFSNGGIDILIGTQMISKGLDFDNVQLVGVINADYGMFIPDFRSGERVFQIISQVIGRSGRREERGKAIIQTYNPNNKNLINAINSNHKLFYASNLAERNELQYPPFTRLCRITFQGKDINKVMQVSKQITKSFSQSKLFKVLGPVEAPISKIKNSWRINSLIIASKDNPMEIQEYFKTKIGINFLEKKYNQVKIKLDIDPLNML